MNDIGCPGATSRRSFLKMGMLGVSGLSLAEVMRLRAEAGAPNAAPDTSVIFVWLAGGPPHMETYDMKPDAPEDYRGQFSPISTNVPGIDVCELLPMHAKCADKYTLIRSIAHTFNDHGGGSKRFMTGRIPATPTGTLNDSPSVISIGTRDTDNTFTGNRILTNAKPGIEFRDEPAATGAHRNRFEQNIVLDNGPRDGKTESEQAAVVIRGHHNDLVFRQNTIGHEKPTDKQNIGILVSRHATGFQSADNQFQHVETDVVRQRD